MKCDPYIYVSAWFAFFFNVVEQRFSGDVIMHYVF